MTDQLFLEKIYDVASELYGRELTIAEKDQIINNFNNSKGTNYERAKIAIHKVTGKNVPERFLLLEKAAAVNNLQVLVSEMKAAAEQWSKK